MALTQTENLQLELTDGPTEFDTKKVKGNFEKIDAAYGELTENLGAFNTQLKPKRIASENLNDAYPSSAGINVHICVPSDKNIPSANTGFLMSFYFDSNARVQLFYPLDKNKIYKRQGTGTWATI